MPHNRARRRPAIITDIGAGKVGKRVLSLPAVQSTPAFRPPFYLRFTSYRARLPNGRRIRREDLHREYRVLAVAIKKRNLVLSVFFSLFRFLLPSFPKSSERAPISHFFQKVLQRNGDVKKKKIAK